MSRAVRKNATFCIVDVVVDSETPAPAEIPLSARLRNPEQPLSPSSNAAEEEIMHNSFSLHAITRSILNKTLVFSLFDTHIRIRFLLSPLIAP